ncbi:MAG TPA: ABC transporter permease [Opitutaceae bacterium]|jgi:ABC-2 type transport system permease protein|nr:ABC transporter permease [Opitutaceae bacterium]
MRGFLCHFGLTLRLNFAQRQPMIYGYAVPVLFLVAFAAVFRSGLPPLLHQMAPLLTISALGSACFGLPTALVSERERGWWRRYRLLPGALGPLVGSTLAARVVLLGSAGALQLALARWIYGTPWPESWGCFAAAYAGTAFAFLGLGLLIAALASDVPAVQALGQCVFLPMIMIGGVGIPLSALPPWAQAFAGFLPGRYAVQAIAAGYFPDARGAAFGWNLAALGLVGLSAGLAGAVLFRWDQAPRPRRALSWGAAALVPWIVLGLLALRTGTWRADPDAAGTPAWAITPEQIADLSYADLPPDEGIITPLAPPGRALEAGPRARLEKFRAQLAEWAPGRASGSGQAIRSLISVAAVADLAEDPLEGDIGRAVFDQLRDRFRGPDLERGLAAVILDSQGGRILAGAPELGLPGNFRPSDIRARDAIYALKFLGRLRGRLGDPPPAAAPTR